MHWDHGDDIEDLSPIGLGAFRDKKTRSAQNSVGRMVDFRLMPDGQAAEVTFRTSDREATRKVREGDVYVSPVIMPRWKIGTGQNLQDVITHLDLVNHPVDHSQGPAREIKDSPAIACALRMGLDVKPYRLASEGSKNGR